MTNDQGHLPFWVRRVILPMASAGLTWYVVHSYLPELLPGPWPDMLAHPFMEILAELLVTAGYLLVAQVRLRWLLVVLSAGLVFGLTYFVPIIVQMPRLAQLPESPAAAGIVYAIIGGLTWGGAILLLVGHYEATLRGAEERSSDDFPGVSVSEHGYLNIFPEGFMDNFGEELSNYILWVIAYALCALGGAGLVGVVVWHLFGELWYTSLLVAGGALALLSGAPFVVRKMAGRWEGRP